MRSENGWREGDSVPRKVQQAGFHSLVSMLKSFSINGWWFRRSFQIIVKNLREKEDEAKEDRRRGEDTLTFCN
jgi:hypothetical protein